MKKLVFTLASVSVVCACGLVIDPDKLVEGNASPSTNATTEAGPDTSGGETDSGAATDTGLVDTGAVEVPECVPALPNTPGVKGPYAVVSAPKGAPIACPSGYLPTVVDQGDGQFVAPPAECNNAAGCSCGTATGTAKCGLRVRYYDDTQCAGGEADSPTSLSGFGSCWDLDNKDYIKLETTVSGITCPPAGTAAPTAKATPSFGTTTIVCAPDPNVKTAQCKGTDIPMPAASSAAACIIVPTNASCSGVDYGSARLLSKTSAFTDTRSCACGCTGNAAASCTGGAARHFSGLLCTGTATSIAAGACQARGNDDAINVETAPTVSGTPGCSTRATPTGEATPTFDLKLCCLGGG